MKKTFVEFCDRLFVRGVGLGLLLLLAGCASAPKTPKDFVFFPPPPDAPRLQFLTGFGMESDLRAKGGFSDFVLGQERMVRPIWKPYGVSARRGVLYVADTQAANVAIVDLIKSRIRYLKPAGPGALKLPIAAVVDDASNVFVSDSSRGQVLIFDAQENLRGTIGQPSELKPAGLQLVGNKLYVCDIKNHRVGVYDAKTWELLQTYPTGAAAGTNAGPGHLFSPTNVAVDQNGRVYVSDSASFMVQVYEADGTHVRTIGDLGLKPGRFALPKGIGVDRLGRTYVVDAATAVVQMFDPEGQLLMYFGEPQTSGRGALYLPAGLCVDYDNVDLFQKYAAPGQKIEFLIHVVNQAGSQKVGTYGFLKKP